MGKLEQIPPGMTIPAASATPVNKHSQPRLVMKDDLCGLSHVRLLYSSTPFSLSLIELKVLSRVKEVYYIQLQQHHNQGEGARTHTCPFSAIVFRHSFFLFAPPEQPGLLSLHSKNFDNILPPTYPLSAAQPDLLCLFLLACWLAGLLLKA